mgnify:CR=1 FL=1
MAYREEGGAVASTPLNHLLVHSTCGGVGVVEDTYAGAGVTIDRWMVHRPQWSRRLTRGINCLLTLHHIALDILLYLSMNGSVCLSVS